jgi:hypothetical protein
MSRVLAHFFVLALFGAHCAQAQTQPARAVLPAQPTPAEPVGLPYLQEGVCNSGVLDPQNPPFIQRTGVSFGAEPEQNQYSYAAVIQLVSESQLCGTPPPPRLRHIDIGPLPLGTHRITVTMIIDGQSRPDYTVQVPVKADPGMPSHVSGIWFDPQQGGRGVFVTRMSTSRLALVWFTHDADGDPTWVLATGDIDWRQSQFSAVAINTDGPGLAPGPAEIEEQVWGELGFRYVGCDRAELSWNAIDPRIVDGSQSLVRLSRADALPACAPEFSGRAFWQ